MEKSNKRGKIPQSDWPLIMARYEAGETLASIARTYDCSPPAISYVVSRSRDRSATEVPKTAAAVDAVAVKLGLPETPRSNSDSGKNLVMKNGPEAELPAQPVQRDLLQHGPPNGHGTQNGPMIEPPQMTQAANVQQPVQGLAAKPVGSDTRSEPASAGPDRAAGNGQGHANGDHRRTLHLSLGGTPHSNGSNGHVPAAEMRDARREQAERQPAVMPEPYHRPVLPQRPYDRAPGGFADAAPPDSYARDGNGRKENGSNFIDKELRARVDDDIAAFLAAFDAALLQDSVESRSGLREATDRLLRAGARTRIELERLEARMPLPPRDRMRSEPVWRAR